MDDRTDGPVGHVVRFDENALRPWGSQALASSPSATAGQIRGLLKGVVLKKNGITKLLARTTDYDADTYGQRSWRLASHRSLSSEIRDDQSTYLSLHRPPEAVPAVESQKRSPTPQKTLPLPTTALPALSSISSMHTEAANPYHTRTYLTQERILHLRPEIT